MVNSTVNVAGECGNCLGINTDSQNLVEVEFFGQWFGSIRSMLEGTECPPSPAGVVLP